MQNFEHSQRSLSDPLSVYYTLTPDDSAIMTHKGGNRPRCLMLSGGTGDVVIEGDNQVPITISITSSGFVLIPCEIRRLMESSTYTGSIIGGM